MTKILKRFVLFSILILAFMSICSCKSFVRKTADRTPHVCTFDEVSVIEPIGCTTDGITEASCLCGQKNVDVKPAFGHDFGSWQLASHQTCSKYGAALRICSTCNMVEKKVVEKSRHTYYISAEIIDGIEYTRYSCKYCDESFIMDSQISVPEEKPDAKHLFDCDDRISFVVFCAEGIEYIKENLSIFSSDSDYIGNEKDGLVDYEITGLDINKWLIEPKKALTGGASYRIAHSDGIHFDEYGFSDLVISIKRDESSLIALSNEIIYVASLEKESPGYYPYNFEYSRNSGHYFLSLEKADGLSAGNIICVGSATCFDDVVNGDGNNTFGKIKIITTLNDGRILLILQQLTPAELFSALDLNDSGIKNIVPLTIPYNVEDRFKTILFDNEDFASLVSAMYTESEGHLASRGLSIGFKDFDEYLESIKIFRESGSISTNTAEDGTSYAAASIRLKAIIEIPVMFGEKDPEQVGSLMAELTLTVNISALSLKIQMTEQDKHVENTNGGLSISFNVLETTSSELKLDIYSSIVYAADHTPYVFEVNGRKYHYENCSHIDKETDDKITDVSVYSMLGLINEGAIINQCEFCKPATSMARDICVLDKTQGVFHNAKCRGCFSTPPANLSFTEEGSSMLISKGYLPCESCGGNVDTIGTFESNMINRIENGYFGEYTDKVINSVIDSESIKKNLHVGAFSTTLSGIDRQILLIAVDLDFRLDGTTHYSYKIDRTKTYGLRSLSNGIISYVSHFDEHIEAIGFTSDEHSKNLFEFSNKISLFIAGFVPQTIE